MVIAYKLLTDRKGVAMLTRMLAQLSVVGVCCLLFNPALAAGDPQAGQFIFSTCAGCHSTPGKTHVYPTYHVPRLSGQTGGYIKVALEAYRSGERNHPTMLANVADLSDTQIADLVAYLTQVERRPQSPPVRGNVSAGREAAQRAGCAGCHGVDGKTPLLPDYPVLAGQHESYLAHTLRDYRNGHRPQAIMLGIARGLSDRDIADLAAYYASLPPALDYVRYRQPR